LTKNEREGIIEWIKINTRYSKELLKEMADQELEEIYNEIVLKGAKLS
jgi:hypothetical protein